MLGSAWKPAWMFQCTPAGSVPPGSGVWRISSLIIGLSCG
jgi:hypothetical protein